MNPRRLLLAVARQWGLDPSKEDEGPCDKRPGVVFYGAKDGTMMPLAFADIEQTRPLVSDCTHEGLQLVAIFLTNMMLKAFFEGSRTSFRPESFIFEYTDDADDVPSTAQAATIINTIKGKT